MNKLNDYDFIKIKEKIFNVIDGVDEYVITPFLTLPYQMEINNIVSKYGLNIHYYNDGERKIAYISYCDDYQEYNPLKVIKIVTNEELKHNEIMGAILNIGIKRELIGNIYCKDKLYLIEVMEKILPFIKENFSYVSNHKIAIEDYQGSLPPLERKIENIIVTSMRLDNIVSSVFNVSRQKAKEAILNEEVAYNFETKLKVDQKVMFNSYLSMRKKGKVIIKEELKKTRKDHLVLLVEYF